MEALSIEELIEELDKIGIRTHTSKDAIGDAKDMWSPAGEVKPAGIWYATGGAWLQFLLMDMEQWLKDAVYVWEINVDRTLVYRLQHADDTRQCIADYGVGSGMDATLDWSAMAEHGYSGVEVETYLPEFRRELGWYYEWDIESGVVWKEETIQGIQPIAVRGPDGKYHTKVRSAGSDARSTDIQLSDEEAAAGIRGEAAQEQVGGSSAARGDTEQAPASDSTGSRRTPRQCTSVRSYSQTAARSPRRPRALAPYLERGVIRSRRGTKRDAVEVGALTVERIVSGKYEWRDAAYAGMKGQRKRFWDAWHST